MAGPTNAEVKALVVSLLPSGADGLYSLADGDGGPGSYFQAIAKALKDYGTDLIETLRQNVNPATVTDKIPDWEAVLSLGATPVAVSGTTAQRQSQIVAALRQGGTSTLDAIRAVAQPFVQYSDATQIDVIECDRSDLTAAHTYGPIESLPQTVPGPGSYVFTWTVLDTGHIAHMGVQLFMTLTTTALEDVAVTVTLPDASTFTWSAGALGIGSGTSADRVLRAPMPESTKPVYGAWSVEFTSSGASCDVEAIALFIEGIGWNDTTRTSEGLGAAQFDWGVMVDPALTLIAAVDYVGLNNAIQSINPAHCIGNAIRGTSTGTDNEAIPDNSTEPPTNAIPDQCIPG